jgi:hypothetical protein
MCLGVLGPFGTGLAEPIPKISEQIKNILWKQAGPYQVTQSKRKARGGWVGPLIMRSRNSEVNFKEL